MCKPSVTTLKLVGDGPCWFTVRSYNATCDAFSLGWSWRARVANVLRLWADKVEREKSFVIVARGPSQVTFADVTDAATIGFNTATKYMNDLWRDRMFGSPDGVAPSVIMPSPAIRDV